jgi:hypothetical protein
MPLITEKLITLKNAWMASHVTDAEFSIRLIVIPSLSVMHWFIQAIGNKKINNKLLLNI